MRRTITWATVLLLGAAAAGWAQTPMGTAFSYQGRLTDGGSPANGQYDFKFSLYDALSGGSLVGTSLEIGGVNVANGLFTVPLDFGAAAFQGDARWLSIDVKPFGVDLYTRLSPRQELTPTPYALYAEVAESVLGGGTSLWQQIGSNIYYNSGYVGIGTASPAFPLAVEGQLINNINPLAIFRATGTDSTAAVRFANAIGNHFNLGITKDNELALGYNANVPLAGDLLRITPGGNVGLGQLAPSARLHVLQSGAADAFRVDDEAADTSPFIISQDGNVGIGTTTPEYRLEVGNTADSWNYLRISAANYSGLMFCDGEGAYSGQIYYDHTLDCMWFYTRSASGALERMRINSEGNVGIGTKTPGQRLSVNGLVESQTGGFKFPDGTIQTTASGASLWQQSGSNIYYDAGNVGVGTTPATAKLQVAQPGTSYALWISDESTDLSPFVIDQDGNVGIGNSMPAAKLHVAGSVRSTGFQLTTSPTAGYVLTADANGVGTWQAPTGGGSFDLPYSGTISAHNQAAFHVSNTAPGSGDDVGLNTVGGRFESAALGGAAVEAYTAGSVARSVYAVADGSVGTAVHAVANGANGRAIYGSNNSAQPTISANQSGTGDIFQGSEGGATVFRVTHDGTTVTSVLQITGGSDLAEQFDVGGETTPGMVVMIDPDKPGKLCLSRGVYNRCVAGVVSGANGVDTGMVLSKLPGEDHTQPVALSGRVWVYCDAAEKAIEPGDMLTTAVRPGHAMAVTDFDRAHGAVLGKAMSRLAKGDTGLVLALVNLQ